MLSERERAEDHYLNSVEHLIETAKAEGKSQGQIQMIVKLFRENTISLDIACHSLNLSADEFKRLLEEN